MVEEISPSNTFDPAPAVDEITADGTIDEPTVIASPEEAVGSSEDASVSVANVESPETESPASAVDVDEMRDGAPSSDDGTVFFASLAKAMKDAATAERDRLTKDTDRRREAHLAAVNARREAEAEGMRSLADDDRNAIEAWVADEQQRIQDERTRRIADVDADLESSLAEHGARIDREVERVEAAITAYRSDVDTYFQRLDDDDPVTIAQQALRRPVFPDLDALGPDASDETAATDGASDDPAAATPLIGVMMTARPQTKLAQAWAAWNESTTATDGTVEPSTAEDDPSLTSGESGPPSTPSATPAPTSGEGSIEAASPVAAGAWAPPSGSDPSTGSSSSGGALGWLRRDRDRDNGAR
jgi:hypothetical protein